MSFSCVGAHGASTGGDPIYKVMSRRRLSDNELGAYVARRRVVDSRGTGGLGRRGGVHTKLEPSTGWPPFDAPQTDSSTKTWSPVSCMEYSSMRIMVSSGSCLFRKAPPL